MSVEIYRSRFDFDPECISTLDAVNQSSWPQPTAGVKCAGCLSCGDQQGGGINGDRCCCNCFSVDWPGISPTRTGTGDCIWGTDGGGFTLYAPCLDPSTYAGQSMLLNDFKSIVSTTILGVCQQISSGGQICTWTYGQFTKIPNSTSSSSSSSHGEPAYMAGSASAKLTYSASNPGTAKLVIGFANELPCFEFTSDTLAAIYTCTKFTCGGGEFTLTSENNGIYDTVDWPGTLTATGVLCGCVGTYMYRAASDGMGGFVWGTPPTGTCAQPPAENGMPNLTCPPPLPPDPPTDGCDFYQVQCGG